MISKWGLPLAWFAFFIVFLAAGAVDAQAAHFSVLWTLVIAIAGSLLMRLLVSDLADSVLDAVAAQRRRLPMVRFRSDYASAAPSGPAQTAAVQNPVNVVTSSADPEITVQQLADAGVKRTSVGGALSRLAFAAVRDAGTFGWVRDTFPGKDLKAIFRQAPNA